MADVNVSLVVTGESTVTGTYSIVPTPAPVAAEIAKLIEKEKLDTLKTASEVEQALMYIQCGPEDIDEAKIRAMMANMTDNVVTLILGEQETMQ